MPLINNKACLCLSKAADALVREGTFCRLAHKVSLAGFLLFLLFPTGGVHESLRTSVVFSPARFQCRLLFSIASADVRMSLQMAFIENAYESSLIAAVVR